MHEELQHDYTIILPSCVHECIVPHLVTLDACSGLPSLFFWSILPSISIFASANVAISFESREKGVANYFIGMCAHEYTLNFSPLFSIIAHIYNIGGGSSLEKGGPQLLIDANLN